MSKKINDSIFDVLDIMKSVEKILKEMEDHTNPYSDYHNKNGTSPSKESHIIAFEVAEIKLLKLMSTKKFKEKLPALSEYVKTHYKGTTKEFSRKRLRELYENDKDPYKKLREFHGIE